jgi:Eukaryotic phosphomannomutase
MMNISPIGRNCSREERNTFEQYDHVSQVLLALLDSCNAVSDARCSHASLAHMISACSSVICVNHVYSAQQY